MKNVKTLFLVFVLALCGTTANAQVVAQKKADRETGEWRYELQAAVGQASNGSALVRVWTYSKKAQVASDQSAKNAIHGILFKGYPDSNDGVRIVGRAPMIADPAVEAQNAEYFNNFFKDGGLYQRYVSFIGNGVPDQILKVGKEYKVGIIVVVQLDALRKRLEDDGIIKTGFEGVMPSIMVVPSSAWCNKNGFVNSYDNQGITEVIPDYQKALLGSQDLVQAIAALNARLAARGFETKDLNAALKSVRQERAEDMMTTSRQGADVAESPVDVLRRTAKADIWLEIDWTITTEKNGSQKRLTWTMSALDAYTDFVVGGVPPTTGPAEYSSSFQLPIMMETAIQGQFEPFCGTMVNYFNGLEKQGRAIKMRFLTWDDFEEGLQTEYDGRELSEIIEDWLADNTVKGKYGSVDLSPSGNSMIVEQVRVPLMDKRGRVQNVLSWARDFTRMLKNDYGVECNISSKGLGQVQIIIGSK